MHRPLFHTSAEAQQLCASIVEIASPTRPRMDFTQPATQPLQRRTSRHRGHKWAHKRFTRSPLPLSRRAIGWAFCRPFRVDRPPFLLPVRHFKMLPHDASEGATCPCSGGPWPAHLSFHSFQPLIPSHMLWPAAVWVSHGPRAFFNNVPHPTQFPGSAFPLRPFGIHETVHAVRPWSHSEQGRLRRDGAIQPSTGSGILVYPVHNVNGPQPVAHVDLP